MKKTIGKWTLALAAVALTVVPALANNGAPRLLEDRVRHELLMLPYYSVFDNLSFRVDGSTVYLSGNVRMPFLKSDAGNAVKRVEGVTQVVNDIHVLPFSPFDNRIRVAEYRAVFGYGGLYRYAMGTDPGVRIIVDNGHVQLVGFVNSQTDKNIAGIRANGVPGVFSVENDLQVAN
ncbi:MAG: BON domain-containing protein [Bryobacteraceae bacterium]|jgi:hyperosmotically inducible protein